MTVGENIKNARKKAGLTQKELGQKIGLSYQSIAQWENNLRKPKPETLQKLANALGITIWELSAGSSGIDFLYGYLSGIEDERYTRSVFNYTYSAIEQQLIDLFAELNEEGQRLTTKYAESLAADPKYQKETPPEDPEA